MTTANQIAWEAFQESGALATNQYPEALSRAYFNAGRNSSKGEIARQNAQAFVAATTINDLQLENERFREALVEIAKNKLDKASAMNLAYTTIEHGRSSCHDCSDKYDCDFAWDAYNTNGDCLAEK